MIMAAFIAGHVSCLVLLIMFGMSSQCDSVKTWAEEKAKKRHYDAGYKKGLQDALLVSHDVVSS